MNMVTALVSGLVAAVVSVACNVLINYKTLKESCREILSDLRHEKQWTGVWTNEGRIDGPDDEECVTLYLDCREGGLGGYMERNIDQSIIFPTLCANSGFRKKARFFSFSWVHGQRIGKGDGYLYLLDSRNLVLKDNLNRTYNLFKTVSEK